MARRSNKRKTQRKSRRSKNFNLLNVAEAVVIGGAVTQGVFGMSLMPFLTEGWLTSQTDASDNSWELSLGELVKGVIPGGEGFGFKDYSMAQSFRKNLRAGGPMMLGTLILAPIAFKAFKTLTRKPRSVANKLLKGTGIPVVV